MNWIEWISEKVYLLCSKCDILNIESMRLLGFIEHFFTLWYGLLHEIQSIQISFHWKQISALKGVVNFDESNLTPSIIK